eukprot:TRINITY_DN807_c0_g1_i3.p1 TRINITY_DN807_c0_g1~~TRINITY_DN807_c0_g1_i3.p1  ORF type:complete len:598 (+),score=171.29 TRINITY_DN807_c0_g1_i3:48-1841(+)
MSASAFVQLLQLSGYTKKVRPEDVKWIFDYESTRPMLQWLCENISKANVVSEEEMAEFEQLQREGKVLEGAALDEALRSLGISSTETEREDALVTAEKEEAQARADLQEAVAMRDTLTEQLDDLRARQSQVKARIAEEQRHQQQAEEAVKQDSDDIDRILVEIDREINHVCSKLDPRVSGNVHLLAALDFAEYERQDDLFTMELKRYVQKQFHHGVDAFEKADIVVADASLSITDPSSLLIQGESVEMYKQYCNELSRLQMSAVASHREHALAAADEARAGAMLALAQQNRVRSRMYTALSPEIVAQRLEETTEALETAQADTAAALLELADLANEVATLQATPVLTGDYRLKLSRQEYNLEKQNTLLQLLHAQQARHEILAAAFTVEFDNLRVARDRIRAIETKMQVFDKTIARTHLMNELASLPTNRRTVDARDHSSLRLAKALGIEAGTAGPSSIISFDQIAEAANALKRKLDAATREELEIDAKHQRQLNELLIRNGKLHDLLFQDAAAGQPQMTPLAIQDAYKELSESSAQLESLLNQVIQERRAKYEMLERRPEEMSLERNLFVDFYTNPDRMVSNVRRLEQRAEAQKVEV